MRLVPPSGVSPFFASLAAALALGQARPSAAQECVVASEQEISATSGGFGGDLGFGDGFGSSCTGVGDLDGDGIPDLLVGQPGASFTTHENRVFVVFLEADGTVKAELAIGEGTGGFGGALDPNDAFGISIAALPDLNGDGIRDLAVGAAGDDDGGAGQGAVWILFLAADGTVASEQKISETAGGFAGALDDGDGFGWSVAAVDDLDGDGIGDLAVGALGDDDGGSLKGAVWILFLQADGTVSSEQKISAAAGGFGGVLHSGDNFGTSVAAVGDLDGDGIGDLAVGAALDDDGGVSAGAVWILLLETDGTTSSQTKISATAGGFEGDVGQDDRFGEALAPLGDLDGDGVPDLAVGADGAASSKGMVWLLFLNADGTVESERGIGPGIGGFEGTLDDIDSFGRGLASIGDLDGDGLAELAVGAPGSDDLTAGTGSVWLVFLGGSPPCFTVDFESEDDLLTPLVNGQHLDTEFGLLVSLTSSGPNAGLAIFDSTPGGPNDPSQDLDLLVGTGNVLILQTENYPPDANDVFPRPNDDEDGGTISFAFPLPAELVSVDLIDIDEADGATGSLVVLTDGSERQRTYTVRGSWTGDRTQGRPGRRTLDLDTLAAQLGDGFGSLAQVYQEPGFEECDVVRLDVHLPASAALDELRFCLPRAPRAAARARNGSGVNPSNLRSTSRPILGSTWNADLACNRDGFTVLEFRLLPASGVMTAFGERLIDGLLVHRVVQPTSLGASRYTMLLPFDASLFGLELHVQGACLERSPGSSGSRLGRARARLSNALDLVLGL